MKKKGLITLCIALLCAYGAYQLSALKTDYIYHEDSVRLYERVLDFTAMSASNYHTPLRKEKLPKTTPVLLLNHLEKLRDAVAYFEFNAERRGVDDETRQIIDDYTAVVDTLYETVETQAFDFDAMERVVADLNTLFEAALFTRDDPGLKTLSDKWNALSLNFRKS
ncbi:hypothetical protein ACR6HW_09165 [Fusibacter sp. JL298sf-3]